MPIYVLGHTNPDSDSIVGAISFSYLKNKMQEDCIPVRQGEITPETAFILNRFNAKAPSLKTSYAKESVYIVDFSDIAQAPLDIAKATILGIVDHHKLGDLTTDTPLECCILPVGCSNTIIKNIFDYKNIEIPKDLAGMMLCAILSDTVIFKSPTCTQMDIEACEDLSKIAGIKDYKSLGMEMFMAKSNIYGASARDLITRDYKEFVMGSDRVGIGQLEVVDLSAFDSMKNDLLKGMKEIKSEHSLHTVLLLLTDIIKEGSQLLVVSDDASIVERAFNITLKDDQVWLDGVLSRKKQIIPFLQPQFEK